MTIDDSESAFFKALFSPPKRAFKETRADQIEAAFRKFHLDNPRVWQLFERFTNEVIAAGHMSYSADAIFHRIRWHETVETRGADFFKLNNNFTSYYARMFNDRHLSGIGFFHQRKRKSEEQPAR